MPPVAESGSAARTFTLSAALPRRFVWVAALAVAGDLGAHHLSCVAVACAAGVVVAGKLGAVGVLPAAERAACGREASDIASQR